MKEKLEFLGWMVRNKPDFLTSMISYEMETYKQTQKICRIITVILLLVCLIVLGTKFL